MIQGIALLLRPQPGGFLRTGVTGAINNERSAGCRSRSSSRVVITVVAELVLRRTRAGLALRAVGSDETRAHRLGARVNRDASSRLRRLLAVRRGRRGSCSPPRSASATRPRRASSYTLTSITAVVLGGASIFGGRGSFVGALLGAVLLTEIVSAVPFLQIALSWNYWLPGILILVGGRHLLAGARWPRRACSGQARHE